MPARCSERGGLDGATVDGACLRACPQEPGGGGGVNQEKKKKKKKKKNFSHR
jgi:hypothetical protein